jgi:hypothetical protein
MHNTIECKVCGALTPVGAPCKDCNKTLNIGDSNAQEHREGSDAFCYDYIPLDRSTDRN